MVCNIAKKDKGGKRREGASSNDGPGTMFVGDGT